MADQPYRLEIGDFICHVIPDSSRPQETGEMSKRLPTADPEQLRKASDRRHPDGSFIWAYNPLLVQTPDEVILFDSGYGDTNKHVAALVDPADVNRVVITHTHGDHVTGLVSEDGQPTYPNAEVLIQKIEWEWWQDDKIKPTLESKIKQVDGETEIAPGVCLIPAPGHTPGHIAVLLENGGDSLLHLVDTLHAPVQLDDPSWSIAFDSDKDVAAATRQTMLNRAAGSGTLTLLYHFEFPGLGHVVRSGDAFDWKPFDPS